MTLDGSAPLVVAAAMGLVTYALRVAPLLATRVGLHPWLVEYLRLAAPALLAGLAAASVAVGAAEAGAVAELHIGVEWIGVLAALALVVWRRNLLVGLFAAVAIVGVSRALGLAP
jgi:branched-subunit amino acid transport protein